jgi:nitroimidazol reductase NimA-like FMN-containing flavoprotein (pyridoxamine 5'-phosphate oxidase superfamily)
MDMFRKMRREKQALPQAEAAKILENGSFGVLALAGDEGYPYAVPISYVYADGKLYFHCAPAGHKLDAVTRDDKASFCVVARDDVVPEKLTTLYASAIAFGRIRVVADDGEKRRALELLAEKYSAVNGADKNTAEIDSAWSRVCVLVLDIAHLSGKASMELIGQP